VDRLPIRLATHFFCACMQNDRKVAKRIANTMILLETDDKIEFLTALMVSMGELSITLERMSQENKYLIEAVCESLRKIRSKGGE